MWSCCKLMSSIEYWYPFLVLQIFKYFKIFNFFRHSTGSFFLSFQETLPNNYVIPGDNIPGRSEDVCALRESHQQCIRVDNVWLGYFLLLFSYHGSTIYHHSSSYHLSYFALKSLVMIAGNGFLIVNAPRVMSELLKKFSNPLQDWLGDIIVKLVRYSCFEADKLIEVINVIQTPRGFVLDKWPALVKL